MHDDNVVPIRATTIQPGQFCVEEGDLPAGILIDEGDYEVCIEDARLRHYHFGSRLVLICTVLEGTEAGAKLCRFYAVRRRDDGLWQPASGLAAHYPREARAVVGRPDADPTQFLGRSARARVTTTEGGYSKVSRLFKSSL